MLVQPGNLKYLHGHSVRLALIFVRHFSIIPFQPVRHEPDNDQHRESEEEHVVVWKFRRQDLFQQREDGRPGDGGIEVSHPAEYRHENRHERVLDVEGLVGSI